MSRAYYNEHDKFCAQWLRNLIQAGLIAPGDVDERSIEDVHPSDLARYTQCHFFAGIAVWSAALRGSGWRDDRPVWTGSCPCQPFSSAGKGGGTADERHLWPAFFHLIQTAKPPGVPLFGEQVASKDGLAWLDTVWSDMEGIGHELWPMVLSAAAFGAPHLRQRLFFYSEGQKHDFIHCGTNQSILNNGWNKEGLSQVWEDQIIDGIPRGKKSTGRKKVFVQGVRQGAQAYLSENRSGPTGAVGQQGAPSNDGAAILVEVSNQEQGERVGSPCAEQSEKNGTSVRPGEPCGHNSGDSEQGRLRTIGASTKHLTWSQLRQSIIASNGPKEGVCPEQRKGDFVGSELRAGVLGSRDRNNDDERGKEKLEINGSDSNTGPIAQDCNKGVFDSIQPLLVYENNSVGAIGSVCDNIREKVRPDSISVAHAGHLEPSGWNALRGANEEHAGAPGANSDLSEGGADEARERAVNDSPVCSPSSELADPGCLNSAGRGGVGGVGDMGEAPPGDEGAREEWQWIWDALNDGGTDVRVADPQQYNSGSQAEPTDYEWAQADGSADRPCGRGGLLGGLADADSSIAELATGQRPRPGEAQGGRSLGELERCGSLPASLTTGPVNGHWANADWLLCRDGKWRPVEPGTFPLADGPPNRVGQLRAYGNAIVKQAAEEFIQAVMPAL